MKKVMLFVVFIGVLISCRETPKDEIKPEDIVAGELFETIKTESIEKINFKREHGFKMDVELSDAKFEDLKKFFDNPKMKDCDFCEVYRQSLNLQGKELKKFLGKYKDIEYFDTYLLFDGARFCPLNNQDNYQDSDHVCMMSEEFIKADLTNPSTAEFSNFNCSVKKNDDGSYTILRKISAKNSLGVEKEFIYKVSMGFLGGDDLDISNWKLESIRNEEVR